VRRAVQRTRQVTRHASPRCDEQLSATEFATRQWKEKELAIDGEITSFRKSIKNEQVGRDV
jgi:hypothetical protein